MLEKSTLLRRSSVGFIAEMIVSILPVSSATSKESKFMFLITNLTPKSLANFFKRRSRYLYAISTPFENTSRFASGITR